MDTVVPPRPAVIPDERRRVMTQITDVDDFFAPTLRSVEQLAPMLAVAGAILQPKLAV